MANLEADIATARRPSLLIDTDTDCCAASSSAALHAALDAVLKDLLEVQIRLENHKAHQARLDCDSMASYVKDWADQLRLVLRNLNDAEVQRSAEVLRGLDWYDTNLAACREDREKMMQALREQFEKKSAGGVCCAIT